jgi:hypothetical protein
MSVTSELCGDIRERFEKGAPRQYMVINQDWRVELAASGYDVKLYHIKFADYAVIIGQTGRYQWHLYPDWREKVKALVGMIGIENEETSEEILW